VGADGPNRREAFARVARGAGAAAVVGVGWGAWLGRGRAAPNTLRPPGALAEERFAAACIKCGSCVSACPYDTLRLTDLFDPAPVGTPLFHPRKIPCEMCPDVPCARACPTGALEKEVLIEEARMGIAVVDDNSCLSMLGLRCEVCYRACPVIDKALKLEYRHQARTDVHAFFEPVVDPDHCTGCGKCEHACVTEVAAIRVLPRALVLGKVGSHFRLGWTDEGTGTAPGWGEKEEREQGGVPGLDYLNEGLP